MSIKTPFLDKRLQYLESLTFEEFDHEDIVELQELQQIKSALQELEELKAEKNTTHEFINGAYYWVKMNPLLTDYKDEDFELAQCELSKSGEAYFFIFDDKTCYNLDDILEYRLIEQPK